MTKYGKRITSALLAGIALCASGAAWAEDAAPESAFTLSGSATVVSQYRFRGVSLSDEDIAAQAGIGLSHSSGFYIGTWGSNLAGFGTFGGSNVELDLFGGWKGSAGGVDLDVGLISYQYPGTANTDYLEAYGSIGKAFGPVTGKLGIAYAFDNGALTDSNTYVYTDWALGISGAPVTIKAHVGYTDGAFALGANNLWDYSISVDLTVMKGLTFNASYIDTDYSRSGAAFAPLREISDGAFVVSLTASF